MGIFGQLGGAGGGGGGSVLTQFQPNRNVFACEDFILGVKESGIGRLIQSGGGSSNLNISDVVTTEHPGILEISTSASGHSTWIIAGTTADPTDDGSIRIGGGAWWFEWMFKLSNLSDATDAYTFFVGLVDRVPGGSPSDACYLSYTHSVNSGNWRMVTANADTATNTDSTVAATTDWTKVRIEVNADATSVSFLVDGVELDNSPVTANLPTRSVGPVLSMVRSAGSNTRIAAFDYFAYAHTLTTPR